MAKPAKGQQHNIAKGLVSLATPVAKLSADPRNARLHNERNIAAIEASLRLYGQRKPIVVRRDGMVVTAGNGTLDKGNRNQTPIEGDDAEPEEVGELIRAALAPIPRVQGAACYIAGANQVEIQTAMIEAATAAGYQIRWNLIWVKDNHVLGRADYLAKHETILYGWATDGPHTFTGHYRQTVFVVARPRSSVEHPTMKPVALIEPMLMNSSSRGEIVADPFGGSGSTLLAAASTGRRCYTSEISPAYCDVIRKRWGDYARANDISPGLDAL